MKSASLLALQIYLFVQINVIPSCALSFTSTKAMMPSITRNRNNDPNSPSSKKKVIVTGAAGRTGKLVFESLTRYSKHYEPMGIVRSEESAKDLLQFFKKKKKQNNHQHSNPLSLLDRIWVCDVTKLNPSSTSQLHDYHHQLETEITPTTTLEQNEDFASTVLPKGMEEAEAMIICTSSVPKLRKRTVFKALLKVPVNVILRKQKVFPYKDLQFYYDPNQYPEKVDYLGSIAQIDLAKKLNIPHVIFVSSMGITAPHDFLNSLGKDKEGKGHGDVLIWKRKAEEYLVQSGLDYTIIHPGYLKDTTTRRRQRQQNPKKHSYILDVNDNLRHSEPKRNISRMDVANLCIASLSVGKGKKLSFDCITTELDDTVLLEEDNIDLNQDDIVAEEIAALEEEFKLAASAIEDFEKTSKQYSYS